MYHFKNHTLNHFKRHTWSGMKTFQRWSNNILSVFPSPDMVQSEDKTTSTCSQLKVEKPARMQMLWNCAKMTKLCTVLYECQKTYLTRFEFVLKNHKCATTTSRCTGVQQYKCSLDKYSSVQNTIYVPTLTCGHELWVVTERTRYKRPKWASTAGCLGSPLERGGESRSSGRGSE